MSGRVVHLGTDVHEQVQALLPWYLGARLAPQEHAQVTAHIAECPRCQAELAWERQLQAACTDADEAFVGTPADVERGIARMRERIASAGAVAVQRARPGLWVRLRNGWRRGPAWARWTLAAQFGVVVVLSSLLLVTLPAQRDFRTLGRSAVPVANVIIQFRPEATEQDMRRMLRESEARLVYGPTAAGAYLVTVPPSLEAAAVMRLKQEHSVLLVEPLDSRAAP